MSTPNTPVITTVTVTMNELRKAADEAGGSILTDQDLLDLTYKVVHEFQNDGFWEEFTFQVEEAING